MTLKEFRTECLKYPRLKDLWNEVARIALDTQTEGLPLALRVYRGEKLSPQEEAAFEEQCRQFDVATADLTEDCRTYGIEAPGIEVGDVCALYS